MCPPCQRDRHHECLNHYVPMIHRACWCVPCQQQHRTNRTMPPAMEIAAGLSASVAATDRQVSAHLQHGQPIGLSQPPAVWNEARRASVLPLRPASAAVDPAALLGAPDGLGRWLTMAILEYFALDPATAATQMADLEPLPKERVASRTVWLSPAAHKALVHYAERHGLAASRVARDAIRLRAADDRAHHGGQLPEVTRLPGGPRRRRRPRRTIAPTKETP